MTKLDDLTPAQALALGGSIREAAERKLRQLLPPRLTVYPQTRAVMAAQVKAMEEARWLIRHASALYIPEVQS